MKKWIVMLALVQSAWAGSLAEGMVALKQGNYTLAAKVYQQLALEGNTIAQQNLGVLYHQGLGVKKDYTQAAHWFTIASDDTMAYKRVASN